MAEFIVLQNYHGLADLDVHKLNAKDIEEAHEITDGEIAHNQSSEWVLRKDVAQKLYKSLGELFKGE